MPGPEEKKPEEKKLDEGTPQAITVGDKTFTPAQVQELMEKSTLLETQLNEYAPVKKALVMFDMKPDELVEQASGAFGVLNNLMNEGILDETGRLRVKDKPGDLSDPSQLPKPKGIESVKTPSGKDEVNTALLNKINGLESALAGLQKSLGEIDQTQSSLIRTSLEKEIREKFPVLDSEDVSKTLVLASRDRKKDVFTHAEELAGKKNLSLEALRAIHAKEFGVNLEEFDANKLNEPGSKEGAAGIFKGKAFSFRKGKDNVSPKQAAAAFLAKQRQGI